MTPTLPPVYHSAQALADHIRQLVEGASADINTLEQGGERHEAYQRREKLNLDIYNACQQFHDKQTKDLRQFRRQLTEIFASLGPDPEILI